MSKTTENCSTTRPTRTRAPSTRKCYACQCHVGPQESSRGGGVGRKITSVKNNAYVNKPVKVGPDVLPSVARAKSSVHLRPDFLKNKPAKPATDFAETSARLQQEGTSSAQETAGGNVRKITQVSQNPPSIRKWAAIPPNNITTVKTATPRQIWRKKVDAIPPSKLKKPAEKPYDDQPSEDESYTHHVTWDGFDELEYRLGQDCCLCEADLAVASSESSDNQTEFSNLPVVAMLHCGHAFHATCLDTAELVNQTDPFCVFCQSITMSD